MDTRSRRAVNFVKQASRTSRGKEHTRSRRSGALFFLKEYNVRRYTLSKKTPYAAANHVRTKKPPDKGGFLLVARTRTHWNQIMEELRGWARFGEMFEIAK